jgi:hypothetical protein
VPSSHTSQNVAMLLSLKSSSVWIITLQTNEKWLLLVSFIGWFSIIWLSWYRMHHQVINKLFFRCVKAGF